MQKAESIYQQMQAGTLPPESFSHYEHIRLAWYYLNRWDETQATKRFSDDLQTYTRLVGAADKYHHTITLALMRLMASHFSALRDPKNWQEFKLDAQPLFTDAYSLLSRYYTKETLQSPPARSNWQEPDIRALPRNS